ncbi:MAG: thioredoxin-disulfide reductase [Lachnospiraceae bacterium]|jgi:thioredoxin reductase (NADPH)|nr:thioredoxin-disulfide reductase [Lachnospiraceae bacterium]MEE3461785.1 thioredoxin-disulfide reductase [Lachnospiraceae bacterium]
MTDIVIIGAGPAGLTAAIYAERGGKSVTLLDAVGYGGQIINTPDVENYPGIKHVSGFDFATALYEQAESFGAVLEYEKAVKIEDLGKTKKVITENGNEYECYAVIIATGAQNRPLGLPGEKELTGKGISYCATCDGNFFRGKTVAVNGGGNTALEDAAYLSDICKKVYLIHRRDEFRGDSKNVENLKSKSNVEFILNSNVAELIGDEALTAIKVKNKITGEEKVLETSALFIAIGQMPENGAFKDYAELDDKGYIASDETCLTKTAGIFTAGDCRQKSVRQLTTAAGDGATAALAAVDYIRNL